MPHKMNKEVGVVLIVLGLVGTVLFFPLKLDEGKTCLAHQYLLGESGHDGLYVVAGDEHVLAQIYVIPYGLLWWTSLGLTVIGLYLVRHHRLMRTGLNRMQPASNSDPERMLWHTKKGGNRVKNQEIFRGDRSFSVVNPIRTFRGVAK